MAHCALWQAFAPYDQPDLGSSGSTQGHWRDAIGLHHLRRRWAAVAFGRLSEWVFVFVACRTSSIAIARLKRSENIISAAECCCFRGVSRSGAKNRPQI
jgi:hypothetical protein